MSDKNLYSFLNGSAFKLIFDAGVRREILKLVASGGGGVSSYATLAALQTAHPTGTADIIYITEDDNSTYRWDGTDYVKIGGSGAGLPLTTVYLSEHNVPNNAVLDKGSTTFGTDGYVAVNAAISGLSNALVIWDVKTSLSNTIVIPDTVHILAYPGCGAIMRDAVNKPMFVNSIQTFDSANRNNHDLKIIGGIWNGNAKGQTIVGNGTIGQVSVFRFYGVTNLTLSEFTIYEQKCYAVDVINCYRYHASHFVIDEGPGGATFNDGIHWNFCDNVVIRDGDIKCHDDAIAGNTDDQYLNTSGDTYPYYLNAGGPTRNVWIENIIVNSERFGLRLLSGGSRMDNIVVKGLSGSTGGYAVIIDNFWQGSSNVTQPGSGNIGMLTLENIHINVTSTLVGVNSSVINVNCNIENLIINQFKRNDFSVNIPSIYITGSGTRIRSLVVNGYDSLDLISSTQVTAVHIDAATVNTLTTSSIKIDRIGVANASPLLKLTSAAKVDIWQHDGVFCNAITNVLDNSSGTIKAIIGCNVVHTNDNSGSSYSSASTIPRITLSNYLGNTILSGTFTKQTGDAFISGANGGGTITYTGYSSGGATGNTSVGSPLTFSTAETGVTNNSGVWNTTSGNNSWIGNSALDSITLAANASGRILMYCDSSIDASHGTGVIGFRTSSGIPSTYSAYVAGISFGGIPNITVMDGGTPGDSGIPWVTGRWYAVNRSVSGVYTIQESADGASWSNVYTFTSTGTALNYVAMSLYGSASSNHVFYPKSNF